MISGSSACSKSSLYIWKLLVRVLLKPSLKDFKLTLYPLLSLLACETGLSQGLALLGLSVLSYHVLIFRWGDYFLLHRTIVKINAYITTKNLEQVCIFKIHSETSLSFNLPNFLPQSHSQLVICFIFLQIQNSEKRKSINSHYHLTLLTSLCAKLFLAEQVCLCTPPLTHQAPSLLPTQGHHTCMFLSLPCIIVSSLVHHAHQHTTKPWFILPWQNKNQSPSLDSHICLWLPPLHLFPFRTQLAERIVSSFPNFSCHILFWNHSHWAFTPPWLHQNRRSWSH